MDGDDEEAKLKSQVRELIWDHSDNTLTIGEATTRVDEIIKIICSAPGVYI